LRAILDQLNVVPFRLDYSKERLLSKFYEFLSAQEGLNHPIVLIFDEAQNLDVGTLEELRMLSNYETEKKKLVQIILVGQPELRDKLDRPELVQLSQRIAVRCHLGPLSRDEAQAYIAHRLKIAGSDGSIHFAPEACDQIQRFSRGIPRLINVACNNVLLAGYVEEKRSFTGDMVRQVIAEMQGDDGRTAVDDRMADDGAAVSEPVEAPGRAPLTSPPPRSGFRVFGTRRRVWAAAIAAGALLVIAVLLGILIR